jgi:acyl-CoA synthetase (AMP-forming)/AMP-acid ligase II
MAFIVLNESIISKEEIIDYCKLHLASYKKPRYIEFIDELPRNAAGNILKRVLKEPYWNDEIKI